MDDFAEKARRLRHRAEAVRFLARSIDRQRMRELLETTARDNDAMAEELEGAVINLSAFAARRA